MTGPFLYFPHDRLSPAELSAARLDGHVVELGEGYIPADAVETAEINVTVVVATKLRLVARPYPEWSNAPDATTLAPMGASGKYQQAKLKVTGPTARWKRSG